MRLNLVWILILGFVSVCPAQLTSHFQSWLNANGYGSYDFNYSGNSYGGKASASDSVVNQPVIFIHGNSDAALGQSSTFNGLECFNQLFHFKRLQNERALRDDVGRCANPYLSAYQYHSKPNLQKIRAFIQAVKAYTGASKVDIVTHSMGVTLTRKAILGGSGNDAANGGSYNLGSPLTSRC